MKISYFRVIELQVNTILDLTEIYYVKIQPGYETFSIERHLPNPSTIFD